MNITNFISIFVEVTTIMLGIIVISYGPKNKANQLFGLLAFSFAIWVGTNFMADISKSSEMVSFWIRMAIIGPIFMSPLLIYFSIFFPKKMGFIKFELIIARNILVVSLFLLLFLYTKENVSNIKILENNIIEAKVGFTYAIVVINLVLGSFFSIFLMHKKIKKVSKNEKKQILLVTSGLLVAILVGITTNWFLAVLDILVYANIGPLFTFFITLFATIAILKNKLFNITIIATEIFIFLILIFLAFDISYFRNINELALKLFVFISVGALGFLLIKNTISQIKRKKEIEILAKSLEKTNKKLRKLDQLKDDFINIAVHEINTPIASILGYLSVILDEKIVDIDQKTEDYLETINRSSKRLAVVVSNFLNIARMEGGRLEPNLRPIKIKGLIDDVVKECEKEIKARNNKILVKIRDNPIVKIDEEKIREVFINLLHNSIKFTDNGKIEIETRDMKEYLLIKFSDTGKGIEGENIQNIFKKFYQAKNNYTKKNNGVGIGLYVVKSIIKLHKGKIKVKSKINKGTVFFIYLPKDNKN